MVCNEQCLKLFGLDQAKQQTPITKEFNIVGETIRRGDIQIEHAHLTKLNKDFCPSTSDLGSESDSGLGSVRTSKKESDSQKTVSEPESCQNEIHAELPESTICTVTRADSMGTLAQDCYSLDQFDDEFISIFDGHASETLTDLVMQEFSKMQTIDVFQLKSDFEKFERVGGRPVHKPRGNTRVATTVPQMPVKTTTTTEQQTSQAKTSTESQNPVQKREKKMRKKRKMIRQKVEGESSTSSSESDVVQQQKPKRKTQQSAEQPTPAAVNNNQATSESSK